MEVHLVDGTYELFRHYYALPSAEDVDGNEVGAIRGVVRSMLAMIRDGASHVGVATDHTVESFRNDMYDGYKTGEGMDPDLFSQFHPLEDALRALGVAVWPMIEYEADDGMASAAALAVKDPDVTRVVICTPDKDLSQCVQDRRVVQFDRRAQVVRDANGVEEKFGVRPTSIPDYLALVGDSADGFPGLRGWGPKASATLLSRYEKLESIPKDVAGWDVSVRGSARLAETLVNDWDQALLFRDLATLRTDAPLFGDVDEFRWRGPQPEFEDVCAAMGMSELNERASELAHSKGLSSH